MDNDINREKLYSDLALQAPQTQAAQQASPENIQAINELYEALLQIQSEK